MKTPTIHLNGTSRAELQDQLEAAFLALCDAQSALQRAAPNGRDYYPQGPDAIHEATKEHVARLTKLSEVIAEVEAIAEVVAVHGLEDGR